MKHLIVTLLLSSSILLAQKPVLKPTPGDELIKARKHFYTGAVLIGAGGLISVLGATTIDPKEKFNPAMITGGLFYLIGSIITIESFSHIGKAGKLLNEKGITFQPTNSGLSLCYKF